MWMMLAALVAMETVMATQLEISEDMARRLGRASLVADYNGGDFTPKPLFRNIINDAHEWLDLNYRPERPMEELEVALAVGQAEFSVPGIKWVNSMALAGEPRQQLQYIEYADLKRLRDVSAPGVPLFWARQPIAQQSDGENAELLPSTDDFGQYNPTTPANPDGSLTVNQQTGFVNFVVVQSQFIEPLVAGESYTVLVDVDIDDSSMIVYFGSLDNSIAIMESGFYEMVATEPPSGDMFLAVYLQPFGGEITLKSLSVKKTQALPSLPIPWFSLAPAPSQAQSLFVLGSRYSPRMAANSDETWWSATHPAILKKAIRREVESELNRNQGEVEKIELELRKQLRQLEAIEVFERSRGDADDWRIMP